MLLVILMQTNCVILLLHLKQLCQIYSLPVSVKVEEPSVTDAVGLAAGRASDL